jgi:hypothetical protein
MRDVMRVPVRETPNPKLLNGLENDRTPRTEVNRREVRLHLLQQNGFLGRT